MAFDAHGQSWTAAELLRDVRQRARIPDGAADFPDDALLREATEALHSYAGWALQQAGEGRLVETTFRGSTTETYEGAYAPGREMYLPPLAVADTIQSVAWVDDAGSRETSLRLVALGDLGHHDVPTASGDPQGYVLLAGRLRIYPTPQAPGRVRIQYARRLPTLVKLADTYQTNGTPTLQGSTVVWPVAVAHGYPNGTRVDVINPASPYRYAFVDVGVVGGLSGTTSLGVDLPLTQAQRFTGTYTVSLAGTSPYVHLPLEFRKSFTDRVVAQVLRAVGDELGAASYERSSADDLGRVTEMLSPRVKGQREVVVNPNSLLRNRVRRARWTKESW